MLHGAVPLDLAVTAVVVGEKEAVGRDDLGGAAAPEDDDASFSWPG
jgi:hypothetical protein